MKRYTMAALLTLLFSCILPVQALPGTGYAKKVVVEAIEQITRAASKESSESAARKAAKELAGRLGKGTPEIEDLLAKYGDDIGIVLRNERRAKLFADLGDDAAQAFIKNGDAAESILSRIPSTDMARTVRNISRSEARHLDALIEKGTITAKNSSDWLKAVQDKGAGLLILASKNPFLTTVGLAAAAYALMDPNGALSILNWLRFIWEFICAHPYVSAFMLVVVSALYVWFIQRLLKAPWAMVRWLGSVCGGSLWWLITKPFRKNQA